MAAAELLTDEQGHDKITEKKLAELIGTTAKALQRKRERNIIPPHVWAKIDGRIMYSKWRYNEWLESLWSYPRVSNLLEAPSASGSPGTSDGTARRSPSPRRSKGSRQPRIYVLK